VPGVDLVHSALMRRSRTASLLMIFSFLLALSVSGRAAAQKGDADLTARKHFAAGDYQQALDAYVDLYAQTLHPTYLRNIGRCYQNMGVPDKAISAFREYLRKAESLEPKQRAEVEGFIHEMEDLKHQREAPRASPAPSTPTATPAALPVTSPAPAATVATVPARAPAALAPAPAPTAAPATAPAPAGAAAGPSGPSAPAGALPPAMDPEMDANSVAASLRATSRPAEEHGAYSPIYARWWFWTALGAVAVGGVVTALALSSGRAAAPDAMTTLGSMSTRAQ
jgi:tetratricopeptide (TPR) repeat protein